ncbi:peptidoglycan hydrolase FlgJ [Cellvibrio zantedeschiae]|uniref:Peptidoglycan hydrolase FlgJ n=1 Tax=Cellvibrio zantedeschiae TaxID=1237077 RepID=A0ABQ3B0F1_9GAMM|nr:flagellar assembly peptidoglycan hydrolase FlgJ [Cellvibrio zantedeschiae]GGY72428.1 peptidoglycan hydrolase FlgJ [Cellvibrio zantedeschiae]
MTTIDNNSLTAALAGSAAAGKTSAVKDNYFDQNSLNSVKLMGHRNDPAALKEISKKFEAMFVQQMLKSMRDANAVFADGDMFSSEEVKFHQDMMDQQMVLNLTSGEGIGLAKSMFAQMQKLYNKPVDLNVKSEPVNTLERSLKTTFAPVVRTKPVAAVSELRAGNKSAVAQTPEEFVERVKPYAEKAAAELNVGTDVLLAQAALETGWGKHLIHDTDGNNSFNIFNIKATGWQGKSVTVNTLENKQGIAQQERAAFRQYDDYEQSFADYVALIKNNPRYKEALSAGADSESYAEALQKAGYATDPDYADKIKRLLNNDSIRSATDNSDAAINVIADATGVQS